MLHLRDILCILTTKAKSKSMSAKLMAYHRWRWPNEICSESLLPFMVVFRGVSGFNPSYNESVPVIKV